MKKAISIIISVILLISFCSCSNYVVSDKNLDDYNTLANAESFSTVGISINGQTPDEIYAFAHIMCSAENLDCMKKLEAEGNYTGKLYALCGLYYLDNDLYNRLLKKYSNCEDTVTIYSGCIIVHPKISELINNVSTGDSPTVRLNGVSDTIDAWRKRNNANSYRTDFSGGGTPCEMRDYVQHCVPEYPYYLPGEAQHK